MHDPLHAHPTRALHEHHVPGLGELVHHRRFGYRGYRAMLPGDWIVQLPDDAALAAEAFWDSAAEEDVEE